MLNTAAFAGSAALATGALMANKGSLKKWHRSGLDSRWRFMPPLMLPGRWRSGRIRRRSALPGATQTPIIQKAPAPAVLTPKVAYFENYAPETPAACLRWTWHSRLRKNARSCSGA